MTTVPETDDDVIEKVVSEEADLEEGTPLYKIVAYPSDPTLEVLKNMWDRKEIEIPPFQRGFVWKHPQASKLIESFLLGLPVPGVFTYKEPSDRLLVIDGQQRIRTICGFFDERLPEGGDFFLKGVDPKWEGKRFSNLEEAEKRRLRGAILRMVTVEQLDPADHTSIYHIFERLNTGGTGLTPQEVRNSSYHGPFNEMIKDINFNDDWRLIFGTTEPDVRMRDRELVLRFFSLVEDPNRYYKPMKQFMNDFMAAHQWDESIDKYKDLFVSTALSVRGHLGGRPFHLKRGINVAAFDAVMAAFAGGGDVPADIQTRWNQLKDNVSFQNAISSSTTDADTVRTRLTLARHTLFE